MTMITPSYLGETIEYSSLHACRSTLEDPTTEDITEDDFLFMDETSNEEMEILKSIEELRENNSDNEDDEDEMFSNEEEMEFLGNYAEDDAYDIAENALDRLE